MPKVLIIIGSKSDMEYAEKCKTQLDVFDIESTIEISSAHRHPERTKDITSQAELNGYEVIIAMAGLSAAPPHIRVSCWTLGLLRLRTV